ncbi:AAA-like domain protein [Methanobrevibacter cuticularis]|uniref:AAA-like domain protein n=1 Tax=Methanobrevibacter cuticularis TaxID=47311 RepID=A0A166CKP5_9EURY|nr:DNA phosphorothioation-dependent restriction protein DptH [Methanobrevibacter cuticularis]KZX15087.1 AAA-like domain protein [Methanobrevibacter cuticularis]
MSSQFYKYLSDKLIRFLDKNGISSGDKFYIEFDEKEQVEKFYNILKDSSKTENFKYEHLGGEPFESYAIILGDIKLVVVKNTTVENDYIVTLRNRIAKQNKEWKNTSLIVICDSAIDSIYDGMQDLQKGDMPLNSKIIANDLEYDIENSNLKEEEREIVKFCIAMKTDEQFNTTLWEYEEILAIINKGSIDIDEYYGLELFPDECLSHYTPYQMKKRLEENHKFFDEIKRIRDFEDKKSKLESKFDNLGVKHLMNEKWCNTDFNTIKKSKESLDKLYKRINYLQNNEKKTKEGLVYWERPSSHTVAGQRKRHIIIFNDNNLESITLKFEFDSELHRTFLDKNSKKFCNISKNKIIVSLDTSKNGISFHKIKYSHNNETKSTYSFNILVLNSSENAFKSIKTKYEISTYKKKHVKITNDEYNDIIEFGTGLNEKSVTIEHENEHIYLNNEQKITISDKSNYDEKGKLRFTLIYSDDEINFEIIEEKKSQQPSDSYLLWKLKREKQENIIFNDTTASLGTDFFILKDAFKRYLCFEKQIISKKIFYGEIKDDNVQKVDIVLSEELANAYNEIFNYYIGINNIPSLTFLDNNLKNLYEKFLAIFNKEIENIEEKSILSNDPKKLNLLKIGSFKNRDKILLSSLSPINMAFQLEIDRQCRNEEIESNIIKRLRSNNLIPFIYGHDDELYGPSFQNDAHEWLIYEKIKEIAIGSTNTFLANVIEEKIRHFISHFKFLFRTNKTSPLILNFVNLENDEEVVKGIIKFLRNEIINEKYIKIQINIYNTSYKSSFDEFFSCENVNQVKEKFNFNIKNSTNFDADDILKEIQDKIIFYKNKLSSKLNFEYAHISFYNYNSESSPFVFSMDDLESGLSLNGILSSTTFTKTFSGIIEGFGVKNIENFDNILTKTVINLNELASNNRNNGRDSYQKKNAIAKECTDLDENLINNLYESSNWVTFINPNFGLDYFQDNTSGSIVIHYSDQYSSSDSYDSITVTKKSEQYIKLITDFLHSNQNDIDPYKIESVIKMFNSINGEWLLKLLNNTNNINIEHQLSIISAIKYGISILNHEDIIWIPISLQEIVRIANTVNLPKNSFSSPLKDSLIGDISDSLLFIGINLNNPINIYYYPIEVMKEYSPKKTKSADIKTPSDVLNEILNQSDDSFNKKFYRNFFIQLFFTSKEKFTINNFWDEKNVEKINHFKSKLLNDDYIISDKLDEFIGKCAIISFKRNTHEKRVYLDNETLFIELNENDAYNGIGKSISEIYDEIGNKKINISNEFLLSNHEIQIQENINFSDNVIHSTNDWKTMHDDVSAIDNLIYSDDLKNELDETIIETSDNDYNIPVLKVEEEVHNSETLNSCDMIDNDKVSKFEDGESLMFKNGSFVGIQQNSGSNVNIDSDRDSYNDNNNLNYESNEFNSSIYENNGPILDKRILVDNENKFNLDKDLNSLRCFIGTEKRSLRKIHWEFGNSNLGNRHLFIQGGSGQGKTYLIQSLIKELSKQDIPTIIIDYNHAFDLKHLESDFMNELQDKIIEYDVVKDKFPINPFRTHFFEDGEFEDNDDIAERFSSMINNTYNLGARQKDAVYLAILEGLKKKKNLMCLKDLGEELSLANDSHSLSALSQLRLFINKNPFGIQQGFDWTDLEKPGQISIIQLSNYHDIIQKIVVEVILWDLWIHKKQNGSKNKPFIIVLDECQNLNFNSNSPTTKIIKEGRKFGYSGWFATQNVNGLNSDVISLLNIPSEKIFFNLEGSESDRVSKLLFNDLSERKIWGSKISSLLKGECLVYGPVKDGDKWVPSKPYIVKVTHLNERE